MTRMWAWGVRLTSVCMALSLASSDDSHARPARAASAMTATLTVPRLMNTCGRWLAYSLAHPHSTVSPVMPVVVRAFFVEHIAIGAGGRRGGLYAKRVPDMRLIRQGDRTPFVLVELGETRSGRTMPSGNWVVLRGKLDREQCVVYDVRHWRRG